MGTDLIPAAGVTKQICAQCAEELEFCEEVFLLQALRSFVTRDGQTAVTYELNEEGDFRFEPHFFHFKCWEEIQEQLEEEIEDFPPFTSERAEYECACCGSGIEVRELMGTLSLGELHLSRRDPSGEGHGDDFQESGTPLCVCIACLNLVNTNWLELWTDGISERGECPDCVQARCHRFPQSGGSCVCTCH